MKRNVESIASAVADAVGLARGKGFDPPYFVVTVGSNGIMAYGRVNVLRHEKDGVVEGDIEELVKYNPGDVGFRTPIQVCVFDSQGQCVRVQWTAPPALDA